MQVARQRFSLDSVCCSLPLLLRRSLFVFQRLVFLFPPLSLRCLFSLRFFSPSVLSVVVPSFLFSFRSSVCLVGSFFLCVFFSSFSLFSGPLVPWVWCSCFCSRQLAVILSVFGRRAGVAWSSCRSRSAACLLGLRVACLGSCGFAVLSRVLFGVFVALQAVRAPALFAVLPGVLVFAAARCCVIGVPGLAAAPASSAAELLLRQFSPLSS